MPSSADPAGATECLRCELTRTDADSDSSAITLDTSKDLWIRCDNSRLVKSTEWTNEKHSRYLDCLEASFANELYHSMNLRGWEMKKKYRIPYSSNQAAVLGDECREKIDFETNEPLLESTADSRMVIEDPWLPHFTYSSKSRTMAHPDAQERVTFRANGSHVNQKVKCLYGSARISEHNAVGHNFHQDLVGSSAEVTDQNFVNIPGGNSNCKPLAKRLKIVASDCSGKDQRSRRMP